MHEKAPKQQVQTNKKNKHKKNPKTWRGKVIVKVRRCKGEGGRGEWGEGRGGESNSGRWRGEV